MKACPLVFLWRRLRRWRVLGAHNLSQLLADGCVRKDAVGLLQGIHQYAQPCTLYDILTRPARPLTGVHSPEGLHHLAVLYHPECFLQSHG